MPLALACAASLLVSRAHAAEPSPGLNWVRLDGAETCISAAQLAQSVEARVGRTLFAPASSAGLFVDGWVRSAAPSGWQVQLAISSADGRVLGRRMLDFTGDDCHVIDEAVTLVIAVTLHPNTGLPESGIPLDPGTAARLDALFGGEPTDPDPAAMPIAVQKAARVEPRARETAEAVHAGGTPGSTRSWGLDVDTTGGSSLGQLPGLAFGFAAHVAVTPPDGWPIELGLFGFLPTTHEVSGPAPGSGRFELLLGSLAACPGRYGEWLVLRLCAGAEVGRLHAETHDIAVPGAPVDDAIANLFGTLVLRVPLGPLPYVRVGVVGLLPLMQRSYTYQALDGSAERAFRMPQVAARAEIGVGASF